MPAVCNRSMVWTLLFPGSAGHALATAHLAADWLIAMWGGFIHHAS